MEGISEGGDNLNLHKRNYNYTYWLKKAKEWGIPTEGREEEARKEAEARYRREYRRRGAGG